MGCEVFVEPRATYRVQLTARFGFDDAAAIADYLADLGVSHLYCSPYLQAAAGSTHGYDVVDHRRVNAELGGPAGHDRMVPALRRHGLGQVLDIVPNHMAISRENPWWWDVLENGPCSRYAPYFDVEWDPPEAKLRDRVLLPVLGDHYGRVLEAGELRFVYDAGVFTIHYHDHVFPVAPESLDRILAVAAERAHSDDLAFLADALTRLPLSTDTDRPSVHRRHRDKEVLRRRLARLAEEQPEVAAAVVDVVAMVNSDADVLDVLLQRQNYRLAFWRTAERDLGYRRFFDINTLAALRTEDERVFAAIHERVLAWVTEGLVDGFRVDHPDGLGDPEEYFRRLHAACPGAWIVAEKILEPGEALPESWPIAGTTGYDFLNRVGGLFVDPAGEAPLTALYAEFTGESTDWPAVAHQKKHQLLREGLGSDVNRLTALFLEVCERHRRHRDYTRHDLHEALREMIAGFPVYRTYVEAGAGRVAEADVRAVTEAVGRAKRNRADLDSDLFDFLRDLLLLRVRGDLEAELVMRFQQVTGPAMAKGVEDTASYTFNRLVALNEVGGDPGRFGVSVEEFHRACAETRERWPTTMLATSTHDTKRSEDVRLRIALLSEIPERWSQAVRRWSTLNERYRRDGMPDRNTEYLFYQTLVGAWPIEPDRATAYMEKAAREAKVHTSWTSPSADWEAALREFVEGALADAMFREEFEAFLAPLVEPGRAASLAQTLLKLTAPGVPDLYQGSELWTESLVDPDNRRPVDYARRRELLRACGDATPEQVRARADEGLPKLWLIRRALDLRRRLPEAFGAKADYAPLAARGARAGHVVAFARGGRVVTAAPRLLLGLGGDWGDTILELPPGTWRSELTGEELAGGEVTVAALTARFPVALLFAA